MLMILNSFQAIKQTQGNLKNLYEQWRTDLIEILAKIEAYIDFPDEDIPTEVVNEILIRISNLQEQISNHLHDNNIGENNESI